jgi:hypothetical protein
MMLNLVLAYIAGLITLPLAAFVFIVATDDTPESYGAFHD